MMLGDSQMEYPPIPPADGVLQFGRISLSPLKRTLWRDGRQVKIGSRAFDLLVLLARRPGEVISKAELIERTWPDLTIDEIALRVQMSSIRKALGDGDCIAIEAVPRQGYRLTSKFAPGRKTSPLQEVELVGREAVIAMLIKASDHAVITTLVGPAGIGKTAVAQATCSRLEWNFPDGIFRIDLADIIAPSLVNATFARQLGLDFSPDDPLDAVLAFLQGRKMLLLLDTCEHLVEAVAQLAEGLLHGAPGIRILATSREALRIAGEHVVRLSPLGLPPLEATARLADLHEFPATSLFLQRVAPGMVSDEEASCITAICHRLDGLPMAIEIAAAQVGPLPIPRMAAQIDASTILHAERYSVSVERHRTISAAFDWSYRLLSLPERRALRMLSVFTGSFTLAAANKLLAGDAFVGISAAAMIGDLVAKSWIMMEPGVRGLYRLLKTTQAFAREAAGEDGEKHDASLRHALYCLDELAGPERPDWVAPGWPGDHSALFADISSALDWCFGSCGDAELGITLTLRAVDLWARHGHLAEHRGVVERAMARIDPIGLTGTARDLALQSSLARSKRA